MSYPQYNYDNVLNLTTSIPNEVVPESSMKLMNSTTKSIAISAQNANSINQQQFLTFQLPSGNGAGWLRCKSLAFSFNVATTAGAAQAWAYSGCANTANSLIQRITVSCGSQQLEQIQNYFAFYNALIYHCGNQPYYAYDMSVLEGSGFAGTTGVSPLYSSTVDVIMPIATGLFSCDKSIPLWLLAAPLTITIDFASAVQAFAGVAGAGGCTNFQITQPQLYMDIVYCDPSYDQSIRQMMSSSGKAFSIYFDSVFGTSTTQAAGAGQTSYTTGLSLSSLKGTMVMTILNADLVNPISPKLFYKNARLQTGWIIDGQNYPQYQLVAGASGNDNDNNTLHFYALQQMMGVAFDKDVTSCSNRATYPTNAFVTGTNFRRTNTSGFTHTGIPASQATVQLSTAAAATAATVYCFYLYSGELLIDANGSCMIVK